MSCHYTSTSFHIASGTGGTVEITDPPVAAATIAGGTVLEINMPDSGNATFGGSSGALVLDQPSTFTGAVKGFGAQDSIDLVTIGFGANTTLGYSENASQTRGTPSTSFCREI